MGDNVRDMQSGIRKIIFAIGNGITRAPMMEMIMKAELDARGIDKDERPEIITDDVTNYERK